MKKLNEFTISEAIEGLKNKTFSSVELVTACLEQIGEYDRKIKVFITVTDEAALERAKQIDEEISSSGGSAFDSRPLLGVPYACKDNFCTKGVETTAASNILKGFVPPYESTVTGRLKDAGAILIGKTNMDAFAHGSSTEESDFFTTKNPWNITRLPGGSSGGSAAAIASNMVVFAIGGDTGGSTRCPSSWCGVTGLKSTYGRVSRCGLIAMASSTDCPGPITKNAADAAFVEKIIAGKDALDATTSGELVPDYLRLFNKKDLAGLKIGRAVSFFEGLDEEVAACVNNALSTFETLGAQIIDVDLISPKYALAVYTIVQRSEVSSNLARFDGIRFGRSRANFGMEAKKRMMLGAYALSSGYYDQYYAKAQRVRTLLIADFKKVFENVDAIVAPTLPTVAQKVGSSASSPLYGELIDKLQIPASMTGLPSLAFPVGFSQDLPVGAQVIGKHFSEGQLFNLVDAYQAETQYHLKFPDLKQTTKEGR